MNAKETKEHLERFVVAQVGFERARIENFRRMPGGASKETFALDIVCTENGEERAEPMVLRLSRASPLPISIDLSQEFHVLRAAHNCNVPVPRPFWHGADSLGAPFYLIARIEGETIVKRLLKEDHYATARYAMSAQLAEILARIHRIATDSDLSNLPLRVRNGSPAMGELDYYEGLLRRFAPEPHPVLELGIRWLRDRAPRCANISLVHGDYRLGNVIFGPEGVRAVLDWQLAHLGDPMEDLGWISVREWRFGNDVKPIGGISEREEFYRAYIEAGGRPLARKRIQFWEVFGNLKMGDNLHTSGAAFR